MHIKCTSPMTTRLMVIGLWTIVSMLSPLKSAIAQTVTTTYESDSAGNLVAAYASAGTAISPGALSTHWTQIGDQTSISVFANGPGPIYYQWQRDGADLVGATNDSLIVTSLSSADYGFYSVIISNVYGVVTNAMGSPAPVIAAPTTTRLIRACPKGASFGGGIIITE